MGPSSAHGTSRLPELVGADTVIEICVIERRRAKGLSSFHLGTAQGDQRLRGARRAMQQRRQRNRRNAQCLRLRIESGAQAGRPVPQHANTQIWYPACCATSERSALLRPCPFRDVDAWPSKKSSQTALASTTARRAAVAEYSNVLDGRSECQVLRQPHRMRAVAVKQLGSGHDCHLSWNIPHPSCPSVNVDSRPPARHKPQIRAS